MLLAAIFFYSHILLHSTTLHNIMSFLHTDMAVIGDVVKSMITTMIIFIVMILTFLLIPIHILVFSRLLHSIKWTSDGNTIRMYIQYMISYFKVPFYRYIHASFYMKIIIIYYRNFHFHPFFLLVSYFLVEFLL